MAKRMNTPTLPRRVFPKRLTVDERARLRDVLEANGFKPCTHPDCDPRQPSCATNSIHLKARDAVEAAFRLGRGELAAVIE